MNLVEESTIVFRLNGQPFVSELSKIEASLVDAKDKLALLEKGTKEWTDAKKDVKELEAAIVTARQQMDITELTVKQLTALQGDMVKVMKASAVGSEEYNTAAKRIAEISPILEQVRKDMRGVGEETESQTDVWAKYVIELAKMETELTQATAKMNALEKGTEEWTKAKEDVKGLAWEIMNARNQMDLSKMTVTELKELQSGLVEVINKSVKGSEEYNTAAKKLSEVNPVLEAVNKDLKSVGDEGEKQLGMWGQFKEDFTRAFSVVSVFEAGRAIYGFVDDSVREFKNFQSAAAELSAVTGLVGKDLEYLKDTAKDTGPEFGMMGSDMLEAYKLMASAKPELLEQKELLSATTNEAIKLAQASKMELGPATDALASSLNQFGEPASSASRFINVMAAGAKEGSAEISDMAASLKNSGTVAAATKVSFEQTNAVLQSLSTISLKGGEAGNQLKNVLLTLSAGSKETNPQIVGLDKAIENLGKKQMSTAEIAKMFGKENVVAAQHIVNHGTEIKELTKKLTGSSEAYSQAAKNTNTLDFQSKQATATVSTLKTEIGSGLQPILVKIIAGFISFVNVIRAIPAFVSENRTMIIALGAAIVAFNGQLIIATASSLAHSAAEKARAITTQSVTIAQRALNLVMSANPIGAVIAVIAILVGAFVTWYEKSDKVKASVAGLWNTIKILGSVVMDAYKAFSSFDFAKLTDVFKNGASKIGGAFNEGYNGKMNELRKENDANNKKANDKTAIDAKANAKKIAETDQSEHKDTLTTKEKASAKHRADELAKAKEKAQKEKQDAIDADKQGLAEIKKLDIERIKDETTREKEKLKLETKLQIEQIATSKANQTIKAAWEKALNEKLSKDIASLEKKARDEKIADEKKATLEIEKDQESKRKNRIKNSFDAEKAINDFELLMARNNQKEIQRLKLQRLDIEKRETLAKLQTELEAEKRQLKEAYDAEIAKAQAEGKDTTAIHKQYTTDKEGIDKKYLAENALATAKNQQAQTKELEEHNKLRDEKNKKFYAGIKSLMDGDFKGFADGLLAKLGVETKNLSERTKKFIGHTEEVAEVATQGVAFLKKMNDDKLQKDIKNLTTEKDAQIKAWEDKYKKGLMTKDQFEAKTDELNKQYAAKEQELRKQAFEKQKKMDIAQALINGALAIIKSLAMFGWPFGLIAAAATGVMTGVQVASIKSRTFARDGAIIKNAGVPEGARHGQRYGESGISLVDRRSGQELGEMEGGEPIMILSRNTYSNNKPVVDKLLHSSLHRNGAPIYQSGGLMFEDGGMLNDSTASSNNTDTSEQQKAIEENTKLQKQIATGVSDTASELQDTNKILNWLYNELKDLRRDMNRVLGAIATNTAKSAKDIGGLVVNSARFK